MKTKDDALEEEKTLTRNAVAELQSEKSKAEKVESDLEKTIRANEKVQHNTTTTISHQQYPHYYYYYYHNIIIVLVTLNMCAYIVVVVAALQMPAGI